MASLLAVNMPYSTTRNHLLNLKGKMMTSNDFQAILNQVSDYLEAYGFDLEPRKDLWSNLETATKETDVKGMSTSEPSPV